AIAARRVVLLGPRRRLGIVQAPLSVSAARSGSRAPPNERESFTSSARSAGSRRRAPIPGSRLPLRARPRRLASPALCPPPAVRWFFERVPSSPQVVIPDGNGSDRGDKRRRARPPLSKRGDTLRTRGDTLQPRG